MKRRELNLRFCFKSRIVYREKESIYNKQRQPQVVCDGVGVGKIATSPALYWLKQCTVDCWEMCEYILCLESGGTGTFWVERAAAAKSRIYDTDSCLRSLGWE